MVVREYDRRAYGRRLLTELQGFALVPVGMGSSQLACFHLTICHQIGKSNKDEKKECYGGLDSNPISG